MKQLMIILMVMVLLASPVWAQDCIDYREYIHCVGEVDTPGIAYDVAIYGNHAYVADGEGSLQVLDFTNPQHRNSGRQPASRSPSQPLQP